MLPNSLINSLDCIVRFIERHCHLRWSSDHLKGGADAQKTATVAVPRMSDDIDTQSVELPDPSPLTSTDSQPGQCLALVPYVPPAPITGKRAAPASPKGTSGTTKASKRSVKVDAFLQLKEPMRVNPKATRASRQLLLSAFFAPQSAAEATAQLEQEVRLRQLKPADHWIEHYPSPDLDKLLDVLRAPRSLPAWQIAVGARIVNTPGNGDCLYYAVHACRGQANVIPEQNMSAKAKVHAREGNFYKREMCGKLLEYLEQMIHCGTISLASLFQRYYERPLTTDNDAALKAVQRAIKAIRDRDIKAGLSLNQWGGDEEAFALVWYVCEPVFVITEAIDCSTSVRLIRLDRDKEEGPEHITGFFPSPIEAYEMIRTFLRHRAISTVLVHTTTQGNGHWQALRFPEPLYERWTADDHEGLAMRARIDQVLVALEWYVPPHKDRSQVRPG